MGHLVFDHGKGSNSSNDAGSSEECERKDFPIGH